MELIPLPQFLFPEKIYTSFIPKFRTGNFRVLFKHTLINRIPMFQMSRYMAC